jgi:hypothetical protein
LAAAGTAIAVPSTAGAATSAESLYQSAIANVAKSGAVHYVAKIRIAGVTEANSGDAAGTSGNQHVTISAGRGAVGRAIVRVVGGRTYLTANPAFYADSGVTTTNPPAATWLSIPSSDRSYQQLSNGVTIGSIGQLIALTGAYSYGGTSRVGGVKVVAVKGTTREQTSRNSYSVLPETVWIRSSGTPVPLLVTVNTSKFKESATFSHYGETMHVLAPKSPVPVSQFEG